MNPNQKKSYSISELPPELINNIIDRLPIKDAVRTSILSRQWRYSWTTKSQLYFESDSTDKSLSIINHVLMLHSGPIHRFLLNLYTLPTTSFKLDQRAIDRWMIVLWRKGIKELVLNFSKDTQHFYVVHSCVFSCQNITNLSFSGCLFKLPPAFKGFPNLSSLSLYECELSEFCLHSLISKCPLLQSLVLIGTASTECLKINCPRLEYLFLQVWCLDDFCLVSAPVLSELRIQVRNKIDFNHATDGEICNTSKILACANSIEKLELSGYIADFFAFGSKSEELPVSFERLKRLHLCIDFLNKEKVLFLLYLLRGSCYLWELIMEGYTYHEDVDYEKNWEINEDLNVLNHLKIVKIIDFHCIESEMAFLKSLLVHAPVLQKMEISMFLQENIQSKLLKHLLQFRRASSQAEIIVVD